MNYCVCGEEQLQQRSAMFSSRIVGKWKVITLNVELSAEPLQSQFLPPEK